MIILLVTMLVTEKRRGRREAKGKGKAAFLTYRWQNKLSEGRPSKFRIRTQQAPSNQEPHTP